MKQAGSVLAVFSLYLCIAIAVPFSMVSVADANAQTSGQTCPVELLDARWKPQPRTRGSNLEQPAFLDLRYANRSTSRIREITVTFKSTLVVHGAMGQSQLPAQRTIVFESRVDPGKSGTAELDIGPSSPGRGTVHLEAVAFDTGMKWKNEEAAVCTAQMN